MKTNQIIIVAVVIMSGVFFGMLSMFRLPQSIVEWIISDAIVGIILFLSYLIPAKKSIRFILFRYF